jgi:hypothetical protein
MEQHTPCMVGPHACMRAPRLFLGGSEFQHSEQGPRCLASRGVAVSSNIGIGGAMATQWMPILLTHVRGQEDRDTRRAVDLVREAERAIRAPQQCHIAFSRSTGRALVSYRTRETGAYAVCSGSIEEGERYTESAAAARVLKQQLYLPPAVQREVESALEVAPFGHAFVPGGFDSTCKLGGADSHRIWVIPLDDEEVSSCRRRRWRCSGRACAAEQWPLPRVWAGVLLSSGDGAARHGGGATVRRRGGATSDGQRADDGQRCDVYELCRHNPHLPTLASTATASCIAASINTGVTTSRAAALDAAAPPVRWTRSTCRTRAPTDRCCGRVSAAQVAEPTRQRLLSDRGPPEQAPGGAQVRSLALFGPIVASRACLHGCC